MTSRLSEEIAVAVTEILSVKMHLDAFLKTTTTISSSRQLFISARLVNVGQSHSGFFKSLAKLKKFVWTR
jgi:hypothetical protein